MKKIAIFTSVVPILFFGCGHKEAPTTALFNGECRIEVESKTSGAEILMDGVPVGHDKVTLQVPCGERLVEVHRKGFVPFEGFYSVSRSQPVIVRVTLNPRTHLENEALSMALVDKVRGPKITQSQNAPQSGSGDTSAPGASSAGGSESPGGSQKWDSVEDWR